MIVTTFPFGIYEGEEMSNFVVVNVVTAINFETRDNDDVDAVDDVFHVDL